VPSQYIIKGVKKPRKPGNPIITRVNNKRASKWDIVY
jgi:hypothetical protein